MTREQLLALQRQAQDAAAATSTQGTGAFNLGSRENRGHYVDPMTGEQFQFGGSMLSSGESSNTGSWREFMNARSRYAEAHRRYTEWANRQRNRNAPAFDDDIARLNSQRSDAEGEERQEREMQRRMRRQMFQRSMNPFGPMGGGGMLPGGFQLPPHPSMMPPPAPTPTSPTPGSAPPAPAGAAPAPAAPAAPAQPPELAPPPTPLQQVNNSPSGPPIGQMAAQSAPPPPPAQGNGMTVTAAYGRLTPLTLDRLADLAVREMGKAADAVALKALAKLGAWTMPPGLKAKAKAHALTAADYLKQTALLTGGGALASAANGPIEYWPESLGRGARLGALAGMGASAANIAGGLAGRAGGAGPISSRLMRAGGAMAGAAAPVAMAARDTPPWEAGKLPVLEQLDNNMRRRSPEPDFKEAGAKKVLSSMGLLSDREGQKERQDEASGTGLNAGLAGLYGAGVGGSVGAGVGVLGGGRVADVARRAQHGRGGEVAERSHEPVPGR